MNDLLNKIDRENKICYLMGDFNIDFFSQKPVILLIGLASNFLPPLFTQL